MNEELSASLSPWIEAAEEEAFEIVAGSLEPGVIFICDHATNAMPDEYEKLGMPTDELERHIAFDIGAETVTRVLARIFKAPAVISRFSRLLIDPNRGVDDPTLVMRISDEALIPGNARIDQAEIVSRTQRFHAPYHNAIEKMIDQALQLRLVPAIVSIHSCTRSMHGVERPWHIGILWDNDPRLSLDLLKSLWAEPDLVVGDNQPYDGALAGDTIDRHATLRGLANTLVELRNDLISTPADAERWGERLAKLLQPLLGKPELREIKHCSSRTRARLRPHG